MSPTPPKLSNRKQNAGIMDRVTEMELALAQMAMATNQAIDTLQNQLSHKTEILDAVVSVLGVETVMAAVEKNRIAKETAKDEARKKTVVMGLEKGELVPEDIIRDGEYVKGTDGKETAKAPGSYIGMMEYDAAGNELPGSYRCLAMAGLIPEFRTKFLGLATGAEVLVGEPLKDEKGEVLKGADGKPQQGKIVVLGVYRKTEKKVEAKAESAEAGEATGTGGVAVPAPAESEATAPAAE